MPPYSKQFVTIIYVLSNWKCTKTVFDRGPPRIPLGELTTLPRPPNRLTRGPFPHSPPFRRLWRLERGPRQPSVPRAPKGIKTALGGHRGLQAYRPIRYYFSVFTFLRFFKIQKKRDFLRFLPCFIRFLELWVEPTNFLRSGLSCAQ